MSACPVCQSDGVSPLDDLRRCDDCGHIFQHPPVITASYDVAYVRKYDTYPTMELSCLRLGFLKAFVGGGRMLDVGHGRGDFVRAACAAGFDAYGNDIHGVDVGVREIDICTDESHWDVITFFDSLEHFQGFEVVRCLLKRTAFALVSIPCNPPTFPADRNWRHYRPGEHLHYFTAGSLQRLIGMPLLRDCDLEDSIRKGVSGTQNIYTAAFGHRSAPSEMG